MEYTPHERFNDARMQYNVNGKETMAQVAQATGVPQSVISDLEKDPNKDADHATKPRKVAYQTVAALAKHYGVSADYLLGLSDDPHRTPSAVDQLGLSPRAIDVLESYHTHTLYNIGASDFCRVVSFLIEQENPLLYLTRGFDDDQPPTHKLNENAILSQIGAYLKDPFSESRQQCFIDDEGEVTIETPDEHKEHDCFDLAAFPVSDLVGQALLSIIADRLKRLRNSYRDYRKKGAGNNGQYQED